MISSSEVQNWVYPQPPLFSSVDRYLHYFRKTKGSVIKLNNNTIFLGLSSSWIFMYVVKAFKTIKQDNSILVHWMISIHTCINLILEYQILIVSIALCESLSGVPVCESIACKILLACPSSQLNIFLKLDLIALLCFNVLKDFWRTAHYTKLG